MRLRDLTGQKFNRFTVIERGENKNRKVYWTCVCDCGKIREVESNHLTSGHSKSCGCIQGEVRHKFSDDAYLDNMGYIMQKANHPKSHRGYVHQHILVAESATGIKINFPTVVHHVDGDGCNNSKNNLVICQDQKHHLLIHRRTRAYGATGHPDWRKCVFCKKWDKPEKLFMSKWGSVYHKGCKRLHQAEYRRSLQCV